MLLATLTPFTVAQLDGAEPPNQLELGICVCGWKFYLDSEDFLQSLGSKGRLADFTLS